MKHFPILALTLLLLAPIAVAQEGDNPRSDTLVTPDDDLESQKRAVIREIKRRRAAQDALKEKIDRRSANYNLMENGAVHQPWSPGNDDPEDWIIMNRPLAQAAAAYSTLIDKEVMVSSKVANRRINLSIVQASRKEATKSFENALTLMNVGVVMLSDEISVLVDDSSAEKQDL